MMYRSLTMLPPQKMGRLELRSRRPTIEGNSCFPASTPLAMRLGKDQPQSQGAGRATAWQLSLDRCWVCGLLE
uniref:AT05157p n=1 Tax=Drosophila melanogaster TaxID=7227 RepID=Q8MZF4_DROME|nr:AT05157p [Drosophila melanogaster]